MAGEAEEQGCFSRESSAIFQLAVEKELAGEIGEAEVLLSHATVIERSETRIARLRPLVDSDQSAREKIQKCTDRVSAILAYFNRRAL